MHRRLSPFGLTVRAALLAAATTGSAGFAQDTSSLAPNAPQPPAVAAPPAATFDADGWAANARERFQLPTAERVEQVKKALLSARDQLRDELSRSPNGLVIAKELELASLDELAEQPSLEQLDRIILSTRLAREKRVQPSIDALRRSLRDFRATVLLAADGQAAVKFAKAVDLLAESMKNSDDPMPNYRELTEAYKFLSETRLLDDLLPPIRQRFSHVNQRLIFTQKFLDRLSENEIAQTRDINENQDGMQLTGVSDIRAYPVANFVPSESRAAVALHLDAIVNSSIQGYKHPATVFAHSIVNLSIDVPVYLSELGVDAPAPVICADANSQLTGMCLHLKHRVLNRMLMPIAQRVAQKKLSEADPEVAEKARNEIGKVVEENREKMIIQVNDLIQRLLWQSFEARDIAANVRFRTTNSELSWTAEYVGPGDLGAPTPPPALPPETEIGIQFHESTFNNTDVSVAGNKINEAIYRETLYDTFKFAPDAEDEDPTAPRIPAVLTFADSEPLRLRFDDGMLTATLRLKAFSVNGKTYADRIRSARVAYKPVQTAEGFSLDREGDIEILDDGGANREEFEIALRRFFKPQFRSATIKDPNTKIKLKVGGLTIEDGWITAFIQDAGK